LAVAGAPPRQAGRVTVLPSSVAEPQVEVNIQLCVPAWLPPIRETERLPPVGLQQVRSRCRPVAEMVPVPPALSVTLIIPSTV
jgi:hypothetical protein